MLLNEQHNEGIKKQAVSLIFLFALNTSLFTLRVVHLRLQNNCHRFRNHIPTNCIRRQDKGLKASSEEHLLVIENLPRTPFLAYLFIHLLL